MLLRERACFASHTFFYVCVCVRVCVCLCVYVCVCVYCECACACLEGVRQALVALSGVCTFRQACR